MNENEYNAANTGGEGPNDFSVPAGSPPQDVRKKQDGMAIASLVLGIVSLLCCCVGTMGGAIAVAGLVLGIVSLKNEKSGMAIAGVILCGIGLFFGICAVIAGALLMAVTDSGVYRALERFSDIPIERFH